jgi:hypothetical protein
MRALWVRALSFSAATAMVLNPAWVPAVGAEDPLSLAGHRQIDDY